MAGAIEITVGDVTDVESHVFARYSGGPIDGLEVRGTLRGPFCEGARTLAAEFTFRAVVAEEPGTAVAAAVVTDPCMWSADMPHLYRVDVEVVQDLAVVAEYHGQIGLRRLAPRRPVDFAPGTG